MTSLVPDLSHPTRLESLLQLADPRPSLHEVACPDAITEARGLGAGAAAAILSRVLDGYVVGAGGKPAARAADVAGQLRLTGAVPALVRCIERLSEFDAVTHAALQALERMRADATAPLLEAYRRCTTPERRAIHAEVLVRACVRDGRVRVALTELLGEDVRAAAGALGEHGDRDAIPALAAALDRLELPEQDAPGVLERLEEVVAVGQAILRLRGKLSKAQNAKFQTAYERSDDIWANGGPEDAQPLTS